MAISDESLLVNLKFDLDDGVDSAEVAARIQEALSRQRLVSDSQVQPDSSRFGVLEVATFIGAAVVLLKAAREGTEALTAFLKAVRALSREIKGIKSIAVDVGEEQRSLTASDDASIEHIARSLN